MINGFEEETADLNDEERRWLPYIVHGLSKKVGVANAVTNKTIAAGMANTYKVKLGDARIRKIINHIRLYGLVECLIATSKGYYIAETDDELDNYIESLHQRADAIASVAKALRAQQNKKKERKNVRVKEGSLFENNHR